ncbi:MAG: hypothetical protein UHL07_04160 [Bacteroidaceae bacterium]|nr:hypothetical protein [Bacteroidaceae bacterium]
MRYFIRNIAWSFLTLCLTLLQTACVNDDEPSLPGGTDKETAALVVSAGLVGSRAGEETIPDEEKMSTLRIIVLHADGRMECNEFMDFSGSPREKYDKFLLVERNETKKIYLIANERTLGDDVDLNTLPDYPTATLEGITFDVIPTSLSGNSDLTDGIPMSACYSVPVGNEARIEKTFWLVRAMTKVTVRFRNGRSDGPVTVKEMSMSAFADKMYLMPQLHNKAGKAIASEKFMVVDNKKDGKSDGDPIYNGTTYNGTYSLLGKTFWIDWLRNAVAYSHTGKYKADDIGWIHQYWVPVGVEYDNARTGISLDLGEGFSVGMDTEVEFPKAFYRAESSHLNAEGDAQEYRVDRLVVTDGQGRVQTWTAAGTPALKLTNMRYLFRHTHVIVDVVFGQKDVAIFARIHPWKRLDPSDPRPLEQEI